MKKLNISRRNFLTGIGGATVALPFLEAAAPSRALAATGPKRFFLMFQCAGVRKESLYPTEFGPLTAASFAGKSTEVLAPYAEKITIPRGIHNWPDGNDGHAPRPVTSSTCSSSDSGSSAGISIDQEIAKHANKGLPRAEALPVRVGAWERSRRGNISWFPGRAAECFPNPRQVYARLMGLKPATPADPAAAAQALERLKNRRESVLDLVKTRMDELGKLPLAKNDRERLDLHFTSIREVEKKMMATPPPTATHNGELSPAKLAEIMALDPSSTYQHENGRVPTNSYLHLELMALAFATNYTRSGSIMYSTVGLNGNTWNFEGVMTSEAQHSLSHGTGNADARKKLAQIDAWHAKHLRFFLDKLSAYQEPGGTILDNSAVVWTNEIDDGNGHNIDNMPYIVVGGLGGYLKTGQHFKVAPGTKNANLWVTMLQGFGIQAESFGVGSSGMGTGVIREMVR